MNTFTVSNRVGATMTRS